MSVHDEMNRNESYISVAEAAEILDITENAVRKRIHRKSLSAVKEGRDWRIRVTDLAAEEIIDVDSELGGPADGRHTTGHGSQQDSPQHDPFRDGQVRDVPEDDVSQQAVPHRDTDAGTGAATGLRLAEQQLAIFVDQFVRPKDERIAELERQLGRLEAETESLVKERDNVRILERENGQLTERIRQLEEEKRKREAHQDQQRDKVTWWRFWKRDA